MSIGEFIESFPDGALIFARASDGHFAPVDAGSAPVCEVFRPPSRAGANQFPVTSINVRGGAAPSVPEGVAAPTLATGAAPNSAKEDARTHVFGGQARASITEQERT